MYAFFLIYHISIYDINAYINSSYIYARKYCRISASSILVLYELADHQFTFFTSNSFRFTQLFPRPKPASSANGPWCFKKYSYVSYSSAVRSLSSLPLAFFSSFWPYFLFRTLEPKCLFYSTIRVFKLKYSTSIFDCMVFHFIPALSPIKLDRSFGKFVWPLLFFTSILCTFAKPAHFFPYIA